jgi:hypothetical protein
MTHRAKNLLLDHIESAHRQSLIASEGKYSASMRCENFLPLVVSDPNIANRRRDHAIGSDHYPIGAVEAEDDSHL